MAETYRTRRVRKAKGRPSSCEAPTGAKPEGRQREVRQWRRGWDSNPRWSCPHAAFRVRYFRPLSHLSASLVGAVSVRGRLHNRGERLAQEVTLTVVPETGPNRQFGLTHRPVSRISRPECGVGLPAPLAFQWEIRTTGSRSGFTRSSGNGPADYSDWQKDGPPAR